MVGFKTISQGGNRQWLALIAAVLIIHVNAQEVVCAIEVRGGKTILPGDHFSVRYYHPTNYVFQFSANAFIERSRKNQLNYAVAGIDVLIEFPFEPFRIGIGPALQTESEPWAFNNYSFTKRLNYGVGAEAGAGLFLTETFSLTAFANQKYFFNPLLGHTSFAFGIGLKYSF